MPHVQDPYVDEDGLFYRFCEHCRRVRWSDSGVEKTKCVYCVISDEDSKGRCTMCGSKDGIGIPQQPRNLFRQCCGAPKSRQRR